MLHFAHDGNPFIFLSAFGLFNLMRARTFFSFKVNKVASLMVLVYLIHENLLFKTYVRPYGWVWIYENYGYDLLFVWVALFSLGLFVASLLLAVIYTRTVGKLVDAIEPDIEGIVCKFGNFVLDRICALS